MSETRYGDERKEAPKITRRQLFQKVGNPLANTVRSSEEPKKPGILNKQMSRRKFMEDLAIAGGIVATGGVGVKLLERGSHPAEGKSSPPAPNLVPANQMPPQNTQEQPQETQPRFRSSKAGLIFKELPPDKRKETEEKVSLMKEVITSNPSYKEMLGVVTKWEKVIIENARRVGFPEDLALGIVFIENGGGEDMINKYSKARGVAQLMIVTAQHYDLVVNNQVDERGDPAKNIRAMADYLKVMTNLFGNPGIAVWGYHAGEGNVYAALREYFIDTVKQDPGDIVKAPDYESAKPIQDKFKHLLEKYKPNIHQILSNPRVQSKVLSNLGDETELYVYKAVAADELLKFELRKQVHTPFVPHLKP